MVVSLAGLSLAGCVLAIYWSAVIFHVVRTWLLVPTARLGLGLWETVKSPPSVCVLVPAHNEADCIGRVARSVLAQDYPSERLSAVFALDRCTDTTASILAELAGPDARPGSDPRVEVIEISECPDGWAGKVHALHSGVARSRRAQGAELLLFIDADTVLDPSCVRACVALMRSRGLSMLSLLSTMTTGRWFERVMQPAAGMELIRQYPIERANDRRSPRPFANGQFILITRTAYDAIGGHAGVREALLEDIEIARKTAEAGLAAGMFLADGLHTCTMYPSVSAFRAGWERIYIEAVKRRPDRLRTYATRVRLLGVWLPLAAFAAVALGWASGRAGLVSSAQTWQGMFRPPAIPAMVCGVSGLVAMFIGLTACYALSRTPVWFVPMYPIGAWSVGSIMRAAAKRLESGGETRWGGRSYKLQARKPSGQ